MTPEQTITAPSGRTYKWDKPTPPTAEDWARLQEYDKSLGPIDASRQGPASTKSVGQQAADFGQTVVDLNNPWEGVKGIASAVIDPKAAVKGYGAQNEALAQKAVDAYKRGDYGEAGMHAFYYMLNGIPGLGATLDSAADDMKRGDYGKGIGKGVGLGVAFSAPAVIDRNLPNQRGDVTLPKPPEQQAVEFGMKNGVTPRLGDVRGGATGSLLNTLDTSAQKMTFAGAKVGGDLSKTRTEGLATLHDQLFAKANSGSPVTRAEAGEAALAKATSNAKSAGTEASRHYNLLESMQKRDPAAFAVDVQAAQDRLRPMAAELERSADLVPPGSATARALIALRKIMSGDNTMKLTDVDQALGELKGALRMTEESDPMSRGAGSLKEAVSALDQQVKDAALRGGGEPALQALERGRLATVKKFDILDTVKQLTKEPKAAVDAMVKAGDGGVLLLREVKANAPEALADIARSVLEGTDAKAWGKLGAETKRTLFADAIKADPQYLANLDKFFKLQDMLKANPNPSGTAFTAGATGHMAGLLLGGTDWYKHALAEIGAAGVTALSNPRVVRALTRSASVPSKNLSAVAAATTELVAALKSAGLPVPAAPTATDRDKQ